MPHIVDGDNLLGSWPGRSRSDADRRELVGQAVRFSARERRRVVVVFDGPPPPVHHFGADVLHSGPGRRADDVIIDFVKRQADRRGWTVVTNDRSLADQCRYLGARVERCDRFREKLAQPREGEKPQTVENIDYWMEMFGKEGPGD